MSGIGLGEAVSGGLGGSENTSPFTGFISATRAAMDKLEEQERLESQVEKTDEVVKILRAPTRILGNDFVTRRSSTAATIAGQQKKQAIIMAWMNKHLGNTDVRVRNLSDSLQDGTILIELLQQLSGFQLKFFHKKPTEEKDIFENLNVLMKFLFFLNVDVQIKPDAIFHGDTTQLVRLMLTIIEKFKTNKGKLAALEHAASVQVIDINPDSGFLRVMLRQREKEKTELDLKMRMEKAKEAAATSKKQSLDHIQEEDVDDESKTVEPGIDMAPLPSAPSKVQIPVVPSADVIPVTTSADDIAALPKSTSFLVRALSSLKREKEKVELDQDLSLDDLDLNILDQDILDLDQLDIEAAMQAQDEMIHSSEVKVVEESSVLDDLDAMEEFLNSIATDENLGDFDL